MNISTKELNFYITVAAIIVLVVIVFISSNASPYLVQILTLIALWGGMASAFNLLAGYAGQVCFIPPLFVGLGAYTSTAMLSLLNISGWVGMIAGGIVAAIISVFIGYLFFRYGLHDVYFALGTMAWVMIGQVVFLNIPGLGKAKGLYIVIQENIPWMMKFMDRLPYFYISLGYSVVVLGIVYVVSRSKMGYWFQAIRENEVAAEAIGVQIVKYKMYAMVITAFLLGVGGTIWAQHTTFIDPYLSFHWEIAGLVIILMIAGGSSTVFGPLLGGVVLIPIREYVRSALGQDYPGAHMVVYSVLLMLILLYLPGGFMEVVKMIWSKITKIIPRKVFTNQAKKPGSIESMKDKNLTSKYQISNTEKVTNKKNNQASPILDAKNLTKTFGGLIAVDDLSFQVLAGETVGLVGPNGAGKTTTFDIVTGALTPDQGDVTFRGNEILDLMPHETCEQGLARTFQVVKPFTNLSVLDTAMIGAFLRYPNRSAAEHKAYETLELLGLEDKAYEQSSALTLADLKRLELAKVLATDPKVVLLDEVVSGLTDVEMEELLNYLRQIKEEKKLTYMIIEHVMQVVMSMCDRIVVMNFGEKIAEGTPKEVASDPKVIEAYLGTEAEETYA